MSGATPSAWSCHARLADDPLEQLYGDELGRRYVYDSHVVNHRRIVPGDLLVVRDRQLIFGYGIVKQIESRPGVKDVPRCPRCDSSDLSRRRVASPRYRCNDCGATFDVPRVQTTEVTAYSAVYDDWWVPFQSPAPVRALDSVYAGRDRQNAIRSLDWTRALDLLRYYSSGVEEHLELELAAQGVPIRSGYVEALAKRRVGQERFRDRLLNRYGAVCAVTGEQPKETLDAAHLAAYAEHPVHEVDGGLLLRADVHRLFDRLLLSFDPRDWRTEVAPPLLERHEHLRALDGVPIAVPTRLRPSEDLIRLHHVAARQRWRDLRTAWTTSRRGDVR